MAETLIEFKIVLSNCLHIKFYNLTSGVPSIAWVREQIAPVP